MPKVGSTLLLEGKVKVMSASVSKDAGRGTRRSLSLQITDMGVEATSDKAPLEDRLYTKGKG